jgi:hypothetical protein
VDTRGIVTTATKTEALAAESALTYVLRWRFEQLTRAGFSPDDATVLACDFEIDLHCALDLRRRGCPAELALRILR